MPGPRTRTARAASAHPARRKGPAAREEALERGDAREAAGADDWPQMDGARTCRGESLCEDVATGKQAGRMVLGGRSCTSVLHHRAGLEDNGRPESAVQHRRNGLE